MMSCDYRHCNRCRKPFGDRGHLKVKDSLNQNFCPTCRESVRVEKRAALRKHLIESGAVSRMNAILEDYLRSLNEPMTESSFEDP